MGHSVRPPLAQALLLGGPGGGGLKEGATKGPHEQHS